MACLSELTCAMYADDELSAPAREEASRHLAGCPRCRALVAALGEESRVLAAVLADEEGATAPAPRPAWWTLAGAGAVAAAVAALLRAGEGWVLRPGDTDWLEVAVDLALFGVRHAPTLGPVVTGAALVTMLLLTAAGAALLVRRPVAPRGSGLRGVGPWLLGGLLLIGGPLGVPSSVVALDPRTGARVSVAAGETVEGPLLLASDAAEIDGTVDGDLIALAGSLEVRGIVRGDLIFAGRRLDLSGSVDGHVYALASEVRVSGEIARSLYGLTRRTRLVPPGRVRGDVATVGREVELGGEVARGAWLLAARARVAAPIGRGLTVRADRIDVVAPARIGGTLAAWAAEPDGLHVDPGLAVGGLRLPAEQPAGRTPGRALGPVLWPAARFFAALAAGVVALALAPRTVHGSINALGAFGRSLGAGLAALVAVPLAVLLLALTLVGLPLALALLALYLGALYGAPLVVAAFVGHTLLGSTGRGLRASLPALVVGLGVVTVLRAVPVVGVAVTLVVVCLGLGGITRQLLHAAGGPASSAGGHLP
jgi:hypothetical protein